VHLLCEMVDRSLAPGVLRKAGELVP
jgi:hypothetical protein